MDKSSLKMPKIVLRVFENLKLVVKQCYQTCHYKGTGIVKICQNEPFNQLTQNVNVARFARNFEWDFFLWFSNTVLFYCSQFFSQYGHAVLLNYLLQPRFNCDPHCITIYQDTPLHLASYNGHLNVVKCLLASSGNQSLFRENIFSETPFHAVCTYGKSRELVNCILDRNCISINIQGAL